MNIIVADYSGFCFGVKNAVSTVYKTTNDKGGRIYTYGPIIHNSTVVNELEQKGIIALPSIEDLKENDTVIIRSHGVSKEVIGTLRDKKVDIVDATCPYVEYIHKKVEEYYNKNYQIIIVGDPAHPEVHGINGWCDNSAVIVNSEEEINNLPKYPKICVVSQTTMNSDKWALMVPLILKISKEIIVFNTICTATEQRQKSAEEIAKKSDSLIVLGGYNSSNTKKLVEICKKYCDKTYHIETINEMDVEKIKNVKTLGITAGASTPDWIIKEAIDKMSDLTNINEENNEQNIMDEYEKTFKKISQGDIVKGKIIYVNDDEASVDIGYKADGLIPRSELTISGDVSPRDILNPGDELDVYILKVNDGEGNVLLSKKLVDAEKSLEYIEEAHKSKTKLTARVAQIVKGGVIADVKGVQVFIPASQLDIRYVEDMSQYLKQEFDIIISEYNPEKRRVIGSRKAVLGEEIKNKKKALFENLEAGQVISGKVIRITDFGAFVDLGGVDGLIHISELSWGRVKHPSEVVKEGDSVEVYVLSVDKDKERISLSLKKTLSEPWGDIDSKFKIGDIVTGKVVRIASFGAFIEIEPGLDGLVHISNISDKRINKVEDALKVGETVTAKIIEINAENKRLSLSIKDAAETENVDVEVFEEAAKEEVQTTIQDVIDSKVSE
ncbi:hypothetical protein OXPF_13340 [Oxobacter pfennigii]|uniref:4-hydroxy-3-methylbut-2-enyl diphosphate reductase n=1 Tax=Oxobacter pfennigii TaxID=36849 RepID=A0A0N8NTH6_9CLOT|nr:bifunctional 4-hydroxy-3-methylbut-2-enyl diphosphate reductase/30S ribosomal protein S1 [Oxobacter pfennigii]KPU44856.1 hypothetical protein OXPF_13340 [Oxobacter pfennigii]